MAVLAAAAGQRDFIFPEGAALTFGVAVLRVPEWSASRWRIVVLVPLCALAGHLLACAYAPLWLRELSGVTIGLLVLESCGARVAPALSAAVLPVVFDVRGWAYPIVVLLTCISVAAIRPAAKPGERAIGHRSWPPAIALRAWLVIGVWIAVAGPLLALPAATLSPPLFVSTLEWMSEPGRTLVTGLRRYAVVVAAAIVGAIVVWACPAVWIAAPLSVLITLAVMNAVDCRHAPALAISLIPCIVHGADSVSLTIAIATGAGALYLGGSAAVAEPRVVAARWRARRALTAAESGTLP